MRLTDTPPVELINTLELLRDNPVRQAKRVRAWLCPHHSKTFFSRVSSTGSQPYCPECHCMLKGAGVVNIILTPFVPTPEAD